jgi:gas vesicle protein
MLVKEDGSMGRDDSGSAVEKLTYLLIGAGIGATLALLFAPKSGRELRNDIADATRRGLDAAGEGARRIGDRATDAYETGRGKVSEIYGTARERVSQGAEAVSEVAQRQKEQIAAAIEAGKHAYREEKRRAAFEGEEA